ncbi:DUF116 domain-containing protein [Methanobacterium sp. CWC-01]|jgi:hypothetical protein|uniref:DUF116 domain-containing protein n=1 Tax=Methanobacterium aridiramus TaxID=2584467 RepID=UPI0025755595|nr:DUF116 domain-containing protein [Methanobacterium sp. CWC-01]WJI09123.1 DUF116 domain-containing protein [Methanobacterium sp. CWC-01]
MLFAEFYQIFGQIVFIAGILLLALLSITLILGRKLLKEDRLIFPRLLLFTIDVFYGLFKKFADKVGVDDKIVDQIGVEVRNKVNEKIFNRIKPQDKILVLPHCLRNAECEATLESSGLVCKNCNRCVIGVLKNKGEEMGYQVFIIPGSTFLKNIMEKNRFKAVLGVACYQDLNLAMNKLSKFHCQGVPLLRDGCVNTKVDSRAVLEKMGVELGEPSKRKGCTTDSYTKKTL